jgi:hypothetical protein
MNIGTCSIFAAMFCFSSCYCFAPFHRQLVLSDLKVQSCLHNSKFAQSAYSFSASRYCFARRRVGPICSATRPTPDPLVSPKNGVSNKIAQVLKSSAAKNLMHFISMLSIVSFAMWTLSGFISPVSAMSKAAAAVPGDIPLAGGGFSAALQFILHLDKELAKIIATYGKTTYAILFGIVFCETGTRFNPILLACVTPPSHF